MTPHPGQKEAFSRVLIDAQLQDVGWDLADGVSVRYEYQLPDGTFADYVLCDRHGRAMAVVEAKRAAVNLQEAAKQGRAYAEQLDNVPFVFLANGNEILFWDYENEAYPRSVSTFFSQPDLERRIASRKVRLDLLTVPADKRIAGRDYQQECIDTLCREMNAGRRKMLVEMATGTGKTRTAAALVKRLFEANAGRLEGFTLDHFGVPPFSNIGGLQRAIQTFGSEEGLARVLDSLNQALFGPGTTEVLRELPTNQ